MFRHGDYKDYKSQALINTTAYKDFLHNYMVSAVWKQFPVPAWFGLMSLV